MASNGCKIQILQRYATDDATALRFRPNELRRRIDANLFVN